MPEEAKRFYKLIRSNKKRLKRHLRGLEERVCTVSAVRSMIDASLQDISQVTIFGIWVGDDLVGSESLYINDDKTGETRSWVDKKFTRNDYAAKGRSLIIDYAFAA